MSNKILVVDDSNSVRKIIINQLAGEGYEFDEAVDGLDGLEKFKKDSNFFLILTDINMPKLDGLGFCEQLRELPEGKKTPIFVISTEGNDELKSRAKALGVMAWMTKPPDATKLKMAVKHVVGLTKK